jgi:hypothetical protein
MNYKLIFTTLIILIAMFPAFSNAQEYSNNTPSSFKGFFIGMPEEKAVELMEEVKTKKGNSLAIKVGSIRTKAVGDNYKDIFFEIAHIRGKVYEIIFYPPAIEYIFNYKYDSKTFETFLKQFSKEYIAEKAFTSSKSKVRIKIEPGEGEGILSGTQWKGSDKTYENEMWLSDTNDSDLNFWFLKSDLYLTIKAKKLSW